MKITGHVTGTSLDDLKAQATKETTQFFGTPCVSVNVFHAVAETQEIDDRTWATRTVFHADYAGAVRHVAGACGRCKEIAN